MVRPSSRHRRAAVELVDLLVARTGATCHILAPVVVLGIEGWCITPQKLVNPGPARLRELWAETCTNASAHGLRPALAMRGHRRVWRVFWSVAAPAQWSNFDLIVMGSLEAWIMAGGP